MKETRPSDGSMKGCEKERNGRQSRHEEHGAEVDYGSLADTDGILEPKTSVSINPSSDNGDSATWAHDARTDQSFLPTSDESMREKPISRSVGASERDSSTKSTMRNRIHGAHEAHKHIPAPKNCFVSPRPASLDPVTEELVHTDARTPAFDHNHTTERPLVDSAATNAQSTSNPAHAPVLSARGSFASPADQVCEQQDRSSVRGYARADTTCEPKLRTPTLRRNCDRTHEREADVSNSARNANHRPSHPNPNLALHSITLSLNSNFNHTLDLTLTINPQFDRPATITTTSVVCPVGSGGQEVTRLLPGCPGTILHTRNRELRREALFRVMNFGLCWVPMQGLPH